MTSSTPAPIRPGSIAKDDRLHGRHKPAAVIALGDSVAASVQKVLHRGRRRSGLDRSGRLGQIRRTRGSGQAGYVNAAAWQFPSAQGFMPVALLNLAARASRSATTSTRSASTQDQRRFVPEALQQSSGPSGGAGLQSDERSDDRRCYSGAADTAGSKPDDVAALEKSAEVAGIFLVRHPGGDRRPVTAGNHDLPVARNVSNIPPSFPNSASSRSAWRS